MAQNLETGLVIKGLSGDTDTLKVNNSIDTNTFLIKDNLNVGINQSNPTEKLEVSGKTKTETIQITSGATTGYVLTLTDNLGNSEWRQITGVSSISGVTPISSSSIGSITTLSIDNSKADDITKGAASFNSSDFNDNNNGLISIDYVNAQKASGTTDGFLSSSDWNTFNNKQNGITLTTTGTSGPSTFDSITGNLSIPSYGGSSGAFGFSYIFGFGGNGVNGVQRSQIDYITISTTSNSTSFGDLTVGRSYSGSTSNKTRGIFAGGADSGNWSTKTSIDYVTIETTGNATNFGDLTVARSYIEGTSGSHGGLA
jgi:hypothetical protein